MYLNNYVTDRLNIRPLNKEDIAIWERFFTYPQAIQFIPAQKDKTNFERAAFWIDKQLTRYLENKYGLMALIHKDTNEFIGLCGLLTQELDNEPVLEIGYHLFPSFWKQGYATESAIFFKNMAFEKKYANELVSIIDINNMASKKVAIRNGMVKIKQTTFWGMDVDVFKINYQDWKNTASNK